MRTFSVELYEKERNRRVIYTAEEFKFCDGRLWIYHRDLGNVVTRIKPDEELTITQDREEEE